MKDPAARPSTPDHYSYTVYADPATARAFDERRFGGPIGELIAGEQARLLVSFLEPLEGHTVLDVGTGTGRAALRLARAGARVTGVDASAAMLAVARQRATAEGVSVAFQVGDAHALGFADRSFDAVVGLRVLMHTPGWRRCIAECCRVADGRVVVDYPSAMSVAALQSMARRLAHMAGVRTEPYRVFTHRAIAEAFAACGFRIREAHRQFVLPIAVHKAIGSRRFTEQSERILERGGLLNALGSPVTLVAERCASS